MPNRKGIRWIWAPMRALLRSFPESSALVCLAILTGACCGLACVGLRYAIHGIQSVLSPWFPASRWLYLALPGLGMLLSLLLVRLVVRDNIGHGVTKVLQAVSKNESRIKRHNVWSSMLTSAVTIGFGGSVGAEAPMVYTGAAIGSNLARYCGMSYRNMTVLLGCGASAAVAGIFNAPLAGVLFTLEILLFNLSMSALLPLLLSAVSATLVSYLLLGRRVHFVPEIVPFDVPDIPSYLFLGLCCGLCSIYFIRCTLALEDRMGRMRNPWVRWLLCAVGLGLLIYLFPPLYGEGYGDLGRLLRAQPYVVDSMSPFSDLMRQPWTMPLFFLLVMLLKVLSMTFTNSGGGVGGTFGPTLFMGGVAGYVVASCLNLVRPNWIPVSDFVLVGMGGLMAGVMQAPLTAIFLIVEISGGFQLLIPLIVCSAVAYGVTRLTDKYSIYTKRIAQSGELLTHDSDQAVLTLLKMGELLERDFVAVRIDATLRVLVDAVAHSARTLFPVVDSRGRFQGYVPLTAIRQDMFRPALYDVNHVYNYVQSSPEYILEDEAMDSVMRKFEKTGAWNLPVVREDRTYLGFLSKSKIFNAYRQELKVFSTD